MGPFSLGKLNSIERSLTNAEIRCIVEDEGTVEFATISQKE